MHIDKFGQFYYLHTEERDWIAIAGAATRFKWDDWGIYMSVSYFNSGHTLLLKIE